MESLLDVKTPTPKRREADVKRKQSAKEPTNKEELISEKKAIKKKKNANKEFARVTYLFVGLFLVMMGYIVYFTAIKSKEIINSPYNVRLDSMAERVVRGDIVDKDGNVLAETKVSKDGTETRHYPYGKKYAHVIGYDSKGKAGLESVQNFNLLTSNSFILEQIANQVQDKKNMGNTVVTTLDTKLQEAAYDALGSYKGAVVVMEVSTGKILAEVSKPTFNPNTIGEDWEWLTTDEESALLNRATQGAYAPGSTFKLVTTLAYMRQQPLYRDYSYFCEGEYTENNTTIHCANKRKHKEEDLAQSLAYSCNASFVNIGLQLNRTDYRNAAEDLLFNAKLPSDLPYRKSNFSLDKNSTTEEQMMTAIGQGKTMTSPYHLALISSAIANGGVLMKPYLVSEIQNAAGTTVKKFKPERYKKLMTSEEASVLKEYMTGVIEYGTATALNNKKYSVAGKTGTAEYSSDKDKAHSWFTGFTNVDNPELAISVVVESADQSGKSAVSVAKRVLDAYY